MKERILALWRDMDAQRWDSLAAYFAPGALIRWPNTREIFTREEFVAVNSEYPGDWRIVVEEASDSMSIIRTEMQKEVYRAISFFEFEGESIRALTEYWCEVGDPPAWRREKGIGRIERS